MSVENKTILITGASRGIGLALIKEALSRGAKRVYAGVSKALERQFSAYTPENMAKGA